MNPLIPKTLKEYIPEDAYDYFLGLVKGAKKYAFVRTEEDWFPCWGQNRFLAILYENSYLCCLGLDDFSLNYYDKDAYKVFKQIKDKGMTKGEMLKRGFQTM